ncbi:GntR family L-lactate dehydrogenase operon transcriptional regulator [Sporomusaceae bacterium BoRhaA]|uniref:FCD domain-containing protein n=1 Tax=Pelorhabdus rhamnosifermentans TaxID=2772457 RepID=UPI001C063BA8|nr:FCD domain-containing protein [Pelorhabdus rhamnosifermentans]MBU2700052.1 GntR family L-lactate dehydrogenase operon transcriptional regulator [Pelorhabdus rhamnosifermentans]
MLSDREKVEYDILRIIRDAAGQPMGCGSIAIKLQAVGYSFSEATVGRILRDLDFAGFTQKAGFRGRNLSNIGIDRLAELKERERQFKFGEELLAAVQGHSKEELLEVLIARRAIESELAYLAAKNAKPDEVCKLKAVLARQFSMLKNGNSAAAEDVNFHNQITNMARNRVLAAAVALIRQDTMLPPVMEQIKRQVHSLLHVTDHQKIVENIASGNGEGARAAVVENINNLIADVEKYWETIDQLN